MPLNTVLRIACDHLAMTGERYRFDVERRFLAHFAHHRIDERFAGLNSAAGQRVEIERRFARAAHHQHFTIADNRGAHRQIRALRVGSLVSHAVSLFSNWSTTSCGVGPRVSTGSPFMIAPARAIIGFSQPMALPASAERISGLRSVSIAARVASSTMVMVTASVSRVSRTFGLAWS